MRKTLIVLIVLAVVFIFYGKSFAPTPSPVEQAKVQMGTATKDSATGVDYVPEAPAQAQ